jgi:Luciferase
MPLRIRVFQFVIAHFGALRSWPALTHSFDFMLAILTAMTAPGVTTCIAKVSDRVLQWPAVTRSSHRLGGRQFDFDGVELGHIHSNGVADIRLTRHEHDHVIAHHLAQLHHVAPQSTWVTFYINSLDDLERVTALFRIPFERLSQGGQLASDLPSDENEGRSGL